MGRVASFPINDESIHYICDDQYHGSSSCQGKKTNKQKKPHPKLVKRQIIINSFIAITLITMR